MPLTLPATRRSRAEGWLIAAPAVLVGSAMLIWVTATPGAAAATVVPLGVAEGFSVLAGSTITNTGTTVVGQDIGVHPGAAITGQNTMVVGGAVHQADAVAQQAQVDLTAAYSDAAGQTPRIAADDELGGETLVGGVYNRAAAMALTGVLTLDGQNDPDSVWVFQAGSTLTTASNASVVLINGADACNVFWQVGSSATLGTDTDFVGTIMADQSITLNTRVALEGRALARVGAVTLDANVITDPDCDPVVTPTVTATVTPSVSATVVPSVTATVTGTVAPTVTATAAPTTTPDVSATPEVPATATGRPSPQVSAVPRGHVATGSVGPDPGGAGGPLTAAFLLLGALGSAVVAVHRWWKT